MNNQPTSPPGQKSERSDTSFQAKAIAALTFLETLLLLAALYHLGFAEGGVLGRFKLAVFGLAAWLVGYIVNRLAIERGVTLAARGVKIAGPISGLSVLIVGVAFFMATFSGLTKPKVEELRLATFLQEAGIYADARIAVADQSAELAPIMQAVSEDLSAQAETESTTGRGPITEALEILFGRSNGLTRQMADGLELRADILAQLASLRGEMNEGLGDESTDIWTRRAELRQQYTHLLGLLGTLDQAVPVSLVRSYTGELSSGVLIPNREDASARINRTLEGYAESLRAALAGQADGVGDPPAFPEESGATDAFAYAGKFAPVLMITAIVDIIAPILIWAYALMTFRVHLPPPPKPTRPEGDYAVILGASPIDLAEWRAAREAEKEAASGKRKRAASDQTAKPPSGRKSSAPRR